MTGILRFFRQRKQPQPACADTNVSAAYHVAILLAGQQNADDPNWWKNTRQTVVASGRSGILDGSSTSPGGVSSSSDTSSFSAHTKLLKQILLSCDSQTAPTTDHTSNTLKSLAQLCWDQRAILVLADVTNHPISVCAAVLDLTFPQTQKQLSTARQALHEVMKHHSGHPTTSQQSGAVNTGYDGNFPIQLNVNNTAPADAAQGACHSQQPGGAHDI